MANESWQLENHGDYYETIFSQENGNFGIWFYKQFHWTSNPLVLVYSNNCMDHTMPGQLGKGSAGASVTFFLKRRECVIVLNYLAVYCFSLFHHTPLHCYMLSCFASFALHCSTLQHMLNHIALSCTAVETTTTTVFVFVPDSAALTKLV